jgi:hypothetical protein
MYTSHSEASLMALLIKYDGETTNVVPQNTEDGFTLKEIYALLECEMIQTIDVEDETKVLICDEEGKLKGGWQRLINSEASRLLHKAGGSPFDMVVGHVLIVDKEKGELQ